MPAARANQTDKEAVRLLAIEFGVREAARRCGLNEDRVRQWSSRYKWFAQSADVQNAVVTTVTRPGDIILDELADNERETRLSLSRYAARAAKDAESADLRAAPLVHKAAQVAGIAHRWDSGDKPSHFTLNMLNINSLVVDKDEQ